MLAQVLIVGAGILGVSVAYYLRKLGETRVVVIDRHCLSAGATGRSGALVRTNYDNLADAHMALMSLDVFRNWETHISGRCGFKAVGLMEIVDAESAPSFSGLIARQRHWGVNIRLIDALEAKKLAPRVRFENCDGSIAYDESAGYCDPNLANRSLYDAARSDGVEFIFDEPVRSVILETGRATGVTTSKRTFSAGAIVLATGAWSNQILRPLGLDFGFIPRLSRLAVFRPHEIDYGETFPTIIDRVQDAWFRPVSGNSILVGAERGGFDGVDPERIPDTAPRGLVEAYRRILMHRFAVSAHAAPRGSWAGAYMMSRDRRPVVGRIGHIPNLFLATGDSGTSFKIAPAIGLGLAELILHGACRSVDLSSLSPDRFDTLTKRSSICHQRVCSRPY
jgi:sarcosine oxidase subunit beta